MLKTIQSQTATLVLALLAAWCVSSACPQTVVAAPSPSPHLINAAKLKIAAIQYPFQKGVKRDEFFQDFDKRVREAAASDAGLVMFPELITWNLVDSHSTATTAEQLKVIAREVTPELIRIASALSRELKISLLAGSSPRITDDGIVNSAILAFPDGRVITQDKLFRTPDEKELGWVEGKKLKIIDAPWGKTAILICFDSEFPAISELLAKEQPEVILIPSMTGDKGFFRVRWSAQARAIEHQAYVVVDGTIGNSAIGYGGMGQAAILTPQEGDFPGLLASGPANQDAIVTGEIDLKALRKLRKESGTYPAKEEGLRNAPITLEAAH